MKIGTIGRVLCTVAVLGLLAAGARAEVLTLFDRNSQAVIDPNSGEGMHTWLVDGNDHLSRQWFWYRIGPTGPEKPINELGDLYVQYGDMNHRIDPRNESATIAYYNDVVDIEVGLRLTGSAPGSGKSDLSESIIITNKGATALDFHFFQYCDLDLYDTSLDANVTISGGNTATQWDERSGYASETVTTPRPSHYEAREFGYTLLSLLDDSATTLNDTPAAGPGDLTWAFQWDFTIPAGQSVLISKDKMIVPEPGTLALLAVGAAAAVARRRRRA
jgi:hypothetical protein